MSYRSDPYIRVTKIVLLPFDVEHTAEGLKKLSTKLRQLDGEIRIVMEHTGMYWRPIAMTPKEAGFFVSEVGDVRRFSHRGALVAYAGVDASPYQSGSFDSKSRHVSKRGSPHLRRVLFVIMSMTLIRANTANPVFCFMDKKRAERKHFYVYTVAGSAKFLRIYNAKVKEYLNALEETA